MGWTSSHIRTLKQRHWMAIGLLIGLSIAAAVVLWPGLFATRVTAEDFERAVTAEPIAGNPVARDVVVHLRGGGSFVTFDWLRPENGTSPGADATAYRYVSSRLNPQIPYMPKTARSQIVDLRINPGAAAAGVEVDEDQPGPHDPPLSWDGSAVARWQGMMKLSGWTPRQGGAAATPDDGAEVGIDMRYGEFDLLVQLDTSQAGMSLGDGLAITMNDKSLPPLRPSGELGVWKTQVTKADFRINERQVLRFAVKNPALRIRQVRFVDPNYTIQNYLAYVKGQYPAFDYQVGWFDRPGVAFPLLGGLGWFLIGILLPTTVRVILRMRELLLLAKAKRMSAMSTLLPGSPKLTIEDWFQLIDLIAALETSLREEIFGQTVSPAGAGGVAKEAPNPADSFVQRQPADPVAAAEEDPDKAFGCKDDDVYPTELGAAAGHVLFTSEDVRELNNVRRAGRGKNKPNR